MPTHEQEYRTHAHPEPLGIGGRGRGWAWAWVWAPNVGLYKEAHNVTLFCQKVGGDADVIHRICCSSGLFSSISLVIITLTLQILKKK